MSFQQPRAVSDAFYGYSIVDYTDGWQNAVSATYNLTAHGANCWVVWSNVTQTYIISDVVHSTFSQVSVDANLKPTLVDVFNAEVFGHTSSQIPIDSIVANVGENQFVIFRSFRLLFK